MLEADKMQLIHFTNIIYIMCIYHIISIIIILHTTQRGGDIPRAHEPDPARHPAAAVVPAPRDLLPAGRHPALRRGLRGALLHHVRPLAAPGTTTGRMCICTPMSVLYLCVHPDSVPINLGIGVVLYSKEDHLAIQLLPISYQLSLYFPKYYRCRSTTSSASCSW